MPFTYLERLHLLLFSNLCRYFRIKRKIRNRLHYLFFFGETEMLGK